MSAYTSSIPLGHLDPDEECEPELWGLLHDIAAARARGDAPPTVALVLHPTTVMQVTP